MPPNLYRTLAHNPNVMAAWSSFGQSLRGYDPDGRISEGAVALEVRTRELAILSVCAATKATYEWSLHARKAPHIGISQAEVDAISRGEFGGFRANENAVLTYARDLTLLHVDTLDSTVAELKNYFDSRSIVELTATIGFYNCVARMLIGLDIEIETGADVVRPKKLSAR
jgi:alkylhydroperoxidase family enzyme